MYISLLIAHEAVRRPASAEVHQGGRGRSSAVTVCQSVHTQALGLLRDEADNVSITHYTSPHIPAPHHTSLHLTTHPCTSPHISAPHHTSLHLTTHPCTSPHIPAPHHTSLHLTTHPCTSAHIPTPHHTSLHLSTP